jgi:hypothetical protein
MTQKAPIRFLYTLRGIDCEFEVVKQYSNGWLCRVVNGPVIGEELVFQLQTIRIGELRLRSLVGAGAVATE